MIDKINLSGKIKKEIRRLEKEHVKALRRMEKYMDLSVKIDGEVKQAKNYLAERIKKQKEFEDDQKIKRS